MHLTHVYRWAIVVFLAGDGINHRVLLRGGESVGSFHLATWVMSVVLRRGFHVFPGLRHENPLVSNAG